MIARRRSSLSTSYEEFKSAANKIGFLVNENKTQHLICTSEERNTFNQLQIGEYKFEKTRHLNI
jgi:hypothetical protein